MSKYSILVVDDEPDNFEVIEGLLPAETFKLNYACRGEEAIASLESFDPDLILLDVMMPDVDGFDICQRIKSIPQWQPVPIVMVTALSGKADLARCLAAGADDYIAKPINGIELRARVHSMLRIKKQYDRIQSLSKLQRNNIHTLENNLNELRLDLSVSFPHELSVPLQSLLDGIEHLIENIDRLSPVEVRQLLDSTNRSALTLNKLNQKFLFYLQLSLAQTRTANQQICATKSLIEQMEAVTKAEGVKPLPKLVFDLEDTELAVRSEHLQYIFGELFDHALNVAKPEIPIHIHGHVLDNTFHFWISNQELKSTSNPESKLSELIQFNSRFGEDRQLGIGLKIVKKIIEIYDGLFLIANTDRGETTVYVTLPLASSVSDLEEVSGALTNLVRGASYFGRNIPY